MAVANLAYWGGPFPHNYLQYFALHAFSVPTCAVDYALPPIDNIRALG